MSDNNSNLVDFLIAEGEDEREGKHRMLYKIRNIFWTNTSNKLEIVVADDKYGIINNETNETLIPPEYDNIFIYGEELFVLYKKGKIGAVRISEHNDLKVQWIADCEYDTMNEQYHNLTFANDKEYKYYNAYTYFNNDCKPLVWSFTEMYRDEKFVYGKTDTEYVIIKELSGDVIWQEKRENFEKGLEPYFMHIGSCKDAELFYDVATSRTLKVMNEGSEWAETMNLAKPIVINGQNIINITEKIENQTAVGIGITDLLNNKTIPQKYDNIKLELKVTMSNETETVEETYEVPNGAFNKKKFVPMENWCI